MHHPPLVRFGLRVAAAGLVVAMAVSVRAEPLPGVRERAEAGDVRAQWALAVTYDTGTNIPADWYEGAKWFLRSAEGGYAPAQAKLGLMYFWGWAVPHDLTLSAHWYEAAARQGEPRAQASIASMYWLGWGVQKNPVRAYAWTLIAAKAGDAQSQWRQPRWAGRLTPEQVAEAESLAARGPASL